MLSEESNRTLRLRAESDGVTVRVTVVEEHVTCLTLIGYGEDYKTKI